MKYELINKNDQHLSATEQILINRNIPIDQIQHYLNTTEQDIYQPEFFGEELLRRAAALVIQTVHANKQMVVIVDCDTDGYTASAILINYLHVLFAAYVENYLTYFVHDSKQHGLSDCTEWILNMQNVGLVICPDSSSNDYVYHEQLANNNIDVLVLDHHEAEKISEYAVVINNQLSDYPNKNLSGAGVTWQFCRYLDKMLNINNAEKYRDLVALGLIADMMSLRSIETKHLIGTGLARPRNPFITKMAERNAFSLKNKLTPIGVAFYIAPFVNAMTRSGTIEEKKLLFDSMLTHKAFQELPSTKRGHALGETELLVDQAVRVATNVKNRQTKAQEEGLNKIEYKIEKEGLLNHKVLLFLMEPGEIDKNIAGLIANKIMAKYQRPVCILTKTEIPTTVISDDLPWEEEITVYETSYAGSARGCDKTSISDFKEICLQTGVCNYAEGHPSAFGLSIKEENIPIFIQKTDQLLADVKDEAIYFVDYIFDANNISGQAILEIANLENLWGKDIDQPFIAIKGLKITPQMVTIYDKKGFTIKIQTSSNVDLLKFHATEQDCNLFQINNTGYVEVDIIGRCNQNQWNGFISPQIFIEQYQVVDSNKYYF